MVAAVFLALPGPKAKAAGVTHMSIAAQAARQGRGRGAGGGGQGPRSRFYIGRFVGCREACAEGARQCRVW